MDGRTLRRSSSSRAAVALPCGARVCSVSRRLRGRGRWSRAAALLAAVLLAASGGCGPRKDAPPLLVLGIDGMDPEILSQLLAAGRMPHFEALAASGGFVPLATTMPPQSPVAWSTFITGLDPVGHGIFDFIHREPRTLQPYLSTSRKGPGGEMELLRRGRPFWDLLVEREIPVTIFKVPANFPPEAPHSGPWPLAGCSCFRAFAGMGTPDMLGTYGTFTWYTDGPYAVPAHMDEAGQALLPGGELEIAGGRIVGLELRDGRAAPEIHGPPSEGGEQRARFELFVDRGPEGGEGAVEIVLAGRREVLRPGEWSPWLRVDYGRKSLSLARLTGIVRFYLKSVDPHVGLYMTPVNLDPGDPAMPVSVPEAEAARLEAALGPYYTQGMPDDTKALEAEVLDYGEFLAQDELALDERREHLHRELGRLDSGFLFFYVHSIDQVSHMLWRTADPAHPGYRTEFAPYGRAIESRYEDMDGLLGEAMAALGGRGEIVVLSDHGFAPYERSFNLNTWLLGEGYLGVREGIGGVEASLLDDDSIAWERTAAYGLGLNALYLNLRGREERGVVAPGERDSKLEEIGEKLLALRDPAGGRQVVERVYRIDGGAAEAADPDLLIGYARGYRASGAAALGRVESEVLSDNLSPWSGDHCMAAHTVPGVLVSSLPLRSGAQPHLRDLPVSILDYYGIGRPEGMTGRSIWPD